MSTFDDASLVFIPSGYKTSKAYSVKPIDGTGDLTFTRSNDTATRVASNGLIEKVRTNLVPQSNTFSNATWNKVNATVTSGQSGYDGTSNAWLLTDDATSAAHSITQFTRWETTLQTGSVYVKAGTNTKAYIGNATTNRGAFFNLSTGTLEGTIGTVVSQSIVSVGSGWYRISVTLEGAGTFIIGSYQTFVSGNFPSSIAYSGSGSNILIQNSQLEAGDIATDYIATTSAAVSVGPVANVPRLDYLNSSCPRLLLEPQRTNLALWSESFDNAGWTKLNATISANAATSPDGYTNADSVIENTATGAHLVQQAVGGGGIATYAVSVFGKSLSGDRFLQLWMGNTVNSATWARFDLVNGLVTQSNGLAGTGYSVNSATIENYGNGWYRCTFSANKLNITGNNTIQYRLSKISTGIETDSYLGNGTSGIRLYGAQVESGASYATSYIPTLGAAVTRGADSASKTGISSLIGQTEGTLFLEANISNFSEARRAVVLYNDGNNLITLRITSGNNLQFLVIESGATQANFTIANPQGSIKMALAYKANDFAAYLNGTLVGTDTSGTVPATSAFYLGYDPAGALQIAGGVSQALIFKTRLSNSDLAALTTL